jgi:hypothetical protein
MRPILRIFPQPAIYAPLEAAFNQKPDTSPLLEFSWWQPVYYHSRDPAQGFPSTSKEKSGRWVGVTETKGDLMTYYVLPDDTKQVLARSAIRPITIENPNLRTVAHGGEEDDVIFPVMQQIIKSTGDLRGNTDKVYPNDKLPSFRYRLLGRKKITLSYPTHPETERPDRQGMIAYVLGRKKNRTPRRIIPPHVF